MARSFLKTTSDFLTAAGAGVSGAPLTLACFLRVDVMQFHAALSLDNGGSDAYFLGVNNGGNVQAQVNAPSGGGFAHATSTTSMSAGAWHHVAAVYSSDSNRGAYLDGLGKGTDTTTVTPQAMGRTELGRIAGFATYLSGALAEAAIWNRALYGVEIRRLALGASPLAVRPDALVFHAPLYGAEDFDVARGRKIAVGSGSPGRARHPRVIRPAALALRCVGRSIVDVRSAGEYRRRRLLAAAQAGAPSTRTVVLDDAVLRVST